MANLLNPENLPPIHGGLADALRRSELVYDYYTPDQIRRVRPNFYNEGNLALKGMIHNVVYNPDTGFYTARAALGNVAAHDNIRIVAGAKDQFGFRPPDSFAHSFAMINTKYYPRIDKSESTVAFDLPKPNADINMLDEEHNITEALALRMSVITVTLARSIMHGVLPVGKPVSGKSSGMFVPPVPAKKRIKSEYPTGE